VLYVLRELLFELRPPEGVTVRPGRVVWPVGPATAGPRAAVVALATGRRPQAECDENGDCEQACHDCDQGRRINAGWRYVRSDVGCQRHQANPVHGHNTSLAVNT
jgi:hypothetical protein